MGVFWQKSVFWIIFFVLLIILIPLLFYFLKPQILSILPISKIQSSEVIKPGSCLILEEKYCSQGERIEITKDRVTGGKLTQTYLAFNLDPGIPFFVPEDGIRLLDKVTESGDPFSGFSAILYKPNPPGGAYLIIGLDFNDMLQVKEPKKGMVIGESNSKGIKNYGATVLVTVTKRSPGGPVTDEDALQSLFRLK